MRASCIAYPFAKWNESGGEHEAPHCIALLVTIAQFHRFVRNPWLPDRNGQGSLKALAVLVALDGGDAKCRLFDAETAVAVMNRLAQEHRKDDEGWLALHRMQASTSPTDAPSTIYRRRSMVEVVVATTLGGQRRRSTPSLSIGAVPSPTRTRGLVLRGV